MSVTGAKNQVLSLLAGTLVIILGLSSTGCDTQSKALLRSEGWTAIQEGRWDDAESMLTKAVAASPGDWRANYLLARVRLHQGRALDAQLLLEHALTQNPAGEDTPKVQDAMAEALYQQGQKLALTTFLEQASARTHAMTDYLRQAKYLGQIGDTDGTRRAFRLACTFADPQDPKPYLALADYYDSIGDRQRAINALRYAYYLTPDSQGLINKLRNWGVVPGPTFGLKPTGVPEF